MTLQGKHFHDFKQEAKSVELKVRSTFEWKPRVLENVEVGEGWFSGINAWAAKSSSMSSPALLVSKSCQRLDLALKSPRTKNV